MSEGNGTVGEEAVTSVGEGGGVHQEGGSSSSNPSNKEDEERVDIDDSEEEDVKQAEGMTTPNTPTAEEYRTHRLTHLPYRSWCAHCVRGKKRNPAHKKVKGDRETRQVPVIAIDYMYMTNREAAKSNPIAVVKDVKKEGVWAFMALKKGSGGTYIASRIARAINFMGYKKCAIKCDQEPAIKDLQKEVREELWEEKLKVAKEVRSILGEKRVSVEEAEDMD
eukprot:2959621-Karenia_brevis.AAC.2